MKREPYFPHAVGTRCQAGILQLIEAEGATGYGIYWALMEYLCSQDNYLGDLRSIRPLARQMKTSIGRVIRILNDYGLFEMHDLTFQSTRLDELMRPLEDKRKAMDTTPRNKGRTTVPQSSDDQATNARRNPCNTLIIKDTSNTVEYSRVEKSKVEKTSSPKPSSSKMDDDGGGDGSKGVKNPPVILAWERHVDSLEQEEQWKEFMAIRSGLGTEFLHRFGEVLQHFKQHVQSVGQEHRILSPSDAKRYFCFYNTPGSRTFLQLVAHLRHRDGNNPYRFEQRDAVTGKRSYCGVPIPDGAPPRPNDQATWNQLRQKWIY